MFDAALEPAAVGADAAVVRKPAAAGELAPSVGIVFVADAPHLGIRAAAFHRARLLFGPVMLCAQSPHVDGRVAAAVRSGAVPAGTMLDADPARNSKR